MNIGGDTPPYLLISLAIGAIIGFLLLRGKRQRVSLSDSAPIRPHTAMQQDSTKEDNGLVSGAAAAAADVSGQVMDAPVHAQLGETDDLQRMKGVGPKFAQMLQARGFTRFSQLAALSEEEIAHLDPELGPFRGRIVRDRIVEQAHYLARGDQDGYEQRFGKL